MLKIGLIGAGIISSRHIKGLMELDDVSIVGVADIVMERARDAAMSCGAQDFTDYKTMVDTVTMDGIIINLPHALHEEATLYCASRGIHIFVEKPLSVSVASCKSMIECCAENNVIMQVGHPQSYFMENIRARDYVLTHELGALCMITDVRTSFYFDENRPAWFFNKALSGGGILMNFGAHSLDKILYLTGSPIKEISGYMAKSFADFDIEGSAQMSLMTDSGVSATITLCGYNKHPVNETTLYFTKGVLRLSTGSKLEKLTPNGFETVCTSDTQFVFSSQMRDFIHGIKTKTPPRINGTYGLHIVSALEKIYVSNEILTTI